MLCTGAKRQTGNELGKHWVGRDNQGGGGNHMSREGGSEMKGEVNTPKYNRDIALTWAES